MGTPPPREPPGVTVGPDQVWFLSRSVVIYARREFPDWEVRGFQRMPIYFQGRKYYLIDRKPGKPPHTVRYEMILWPDDLHEESKISFTYDAASVAERDQNHQTDRQEELIHNLLLPLYPLLGFCWSGFKDRVLTRYGFSPKSVTHASLVVMWGIVLVEAVFLFYFHVGYARMLFGEFLALYIPSSWVDGITVFAGFFDSLVRYNQILRGDEVPDGFLEWLFWWRRRPG